MPTTLLTIDITDRASRLVAADAAEEGALTELATALRDVTKPLILERTKPPVILPMLTHWRKSERPWDRRKVAWRCLRDGDTLLGKLLLSANLRKISLALVPSGFDTHAAVIGWRRWRLDDLERGEDHNSFPDYRTAEDYHVVPGVVLVCKTQKTEAVPQLFTFHVAYDDARRFGFDYVPAFANE